MHIYFDVVFNGFRESWHQDMKLL